MKQSVVCRTENERESPECMCNGLSRCTLKWGKNIIK